MKIPSPHAGLRLGILLLLPFLRGTSPVAAAASFTVSDSLANITIPDNTSAGVARLVYLDVPPTERVTRITVSLEIVSAAGDAAWNGDLVATLSHGPALSVLLNRSGTDATRPFGFEDQGFQVDFRDDAASGDVHGYQATTGILPGFVPLSGTWQPSGRLGLTSIEPSDPRPAMLSVFNGAPAQGEWMLHVGDLGAGAVASLMNWSITVDTMTAVPEAGAMATVTAIGLGLGAALRRFKGRARGRSWRSAWSPAWKIPRN